MEKIRKIMVAYDFSDYSKEALVFALELAGELKSDLEIVNVINQRDVEAVRRAEIESISFSADEFIKDRKKDRREQICQTVEEISGCKPPDVWVVVDSYSLSFLFRLTGECFLQEG